MRGKELDIVVLAGGRGLRMGELTSQKQKCLLVVDGKPVLTHIFDNIIQAFGSANVVVALGFHGADVIEHYGFKYRSLSLQYVCDPRPVETRQRLLLTKNFLLTDFLFLAGDIICHHNQLVKVVETQQLEKSSSYGTISGATEHQSALSHALISVDGLKVTQLIFPPTQNWSNDDLREMHIACYSQNFMSLLESAPKSIFHISKIIAQAVAMGFDFQASRYFSAWYHIVEPEDLKAQIRYQS